MQGRPIESTVLGQKLHEAELQLIAAVVHDPAQRPMAFREMSPDAMDAEEHVGLWALLQRLYTEHPEFTEGDFRLEQVAPPMAKAVADLRSGRHHMALGRLRTARAIMGLQRTAIEAVQELDGLAVTPAAVSRWLQTLQDAHQRLASGMDEPEVAPTVQDEAEAFAEAVLADVDEADATWGLEELDRCSGGLHAGTLHIPLAETGHGKTMLALTAARATAERNHRVLIVPLEQGTRELAVRLCSAATGYAPRRLRERIRGGEFHPEAMRPLVPGRIVVDDQVETVAQIAAVVNEARIAGDPFKLVIVDYLQLIDTMGLREVEGFGENARQLKLLARKQGCAVICPSQPKTLETAGELPDTRHLYGSRMIGNHSDSVVSLRVIREAGWDVYGGPVDPTSMDCVAHTAEVKVCKARAGEVGRIGDVKWGRGTFMLWDSKNAPWRRDVHAAQENAVRDTGSHAEAIPMDADELERISANQ